VTVASVRPFRFGVQATKATSASEWRDLARRIEDLGYSTLFHADHYVGPGPASSGSLLGAQHLAPIASMAAAAAWTNTLRIGCRVFCIDYHVPAVLAKEAATLDLLSDGRLEFGIGAGWHADEYRAMGLTFDDGPRRVDKLEEVVALVKAHWSGEQVDYHGKYVQLQGYSGLPVPVQKPHPPIMIGGSKRRVLSFAAREADIVSLANVAWADPAPFEEIERRLGYVRNAAGDRFNTLDIEISPSFTEVTDDIEGTLRREAPTLRNANPEILRDHPNVLVGPVERIVERLQELREKIAVNYISVLSDQIDAFAPVVARLAGQ
jgi:probable F420-dependent oxidoreductase